MRQHEGPHARSRRDVAYLIGCAVGAAEMIDDRLTVGQPVEQLLHPLQVDHFVNENVGSTCQAHDVLARPSVTREHDRAGGRVEAVGESREGRRMLHEHGRHTHAVVVLRIHHDRFHLGRGRLRARAARHHTKIDVGSIAVASDTELVHVDELSDVGAILVGDAQVDVVRERIQ